MKFRIIKEKAIDVDVSEIEKIVNSISLYDYPNFYDYVWQLNKEFNYNRNYNINFRVSKKPEKNTSQLSSLFSGYFEFSGDPQIVILFNSHLIKLYDQKKIDESDFKRHIISSITHELTHEKQYSKSSGKSFNHPVHHTDEKYFLTHYELMAYANQIINKLKIKGFNKKEMIDFINSYFSERPSLPSKLFKQDTVIFLNKIIPEYEHIMKILRKHPKELKIFIKYLYQYIEKIL